MFSKTGGFPLNLGLLLLSTSLSLYPSVSCTPVHGLDASSVADSQQAFIDAGLVGSVVPTFIPSAIISPIYATNSSKGIKFSPGANLTTDQTKTQPEFWLTYDDPSFCKFFPHLSTFIFTFSLTLYI
ncbi:hypothetical protein K435DRAFT_213620 [Dendrothele bispora CBS 962.96]|uniref:Uncharacterized protein n=1 Tax=Dendrothele bispora (strain CBS 962.96) TaxID=1314807 RepID=A0A4S8LRV1_DENBC|nr:hypothetical protein K435DRAFT_213620 [Dendrothele bispora CBS 962.96]